MLKNGPALGERRPPGRLVARRESKLNKRKLLSIKGLSSCVWYELRSWGTRDGTTSPASGRTFGRLRKGLNFSSRSSVPTQPARYNFHKPELPVSTYGAAHWMSRQLRGHDWHEARKHGAEAPHIWLDSRTADALNFDMARNRAQVGSLGRGGIADWFGSRRAWPSGRPSHHLAGLPRGSCRDDSGKPLAEHDRKSSGLFRCSRSDAASARHIHRYGYYWCRRHVEARRSRPGCYDSRNIMVCHRRGSLFRGRSDLTRNNSIPAWHAGVVRAALGRLQNETRTIRHSESGNRARAAAEGRDIRHGSECGIPH